MLRVKILEVFSHIFSIDANELYLQNNIRNASPFPTRKHASYLWTMHRPGLSNPLSILVLCNTTRRESSTISTHIFFALPTRRFVYLSQTLTFHITHSGSSISTSQLCIRICSPSFERVSCCLSMLDKMYMQISITNLALGVLLKVRLQKRRREDE